MPPVLIAEHLDVIEYLGAGHIRGCIDPFLDSFLLNTAEAELHNNAILTIASPHEPDQRVVEAAIDRIHYAGEQANGTTPGTGNATFSCGTMRCD